MHNLKEEIGKKRLKFEDNVETGVFGLRLFKTADNQYGEGGTNLAQLLNELRSAHARHDVVGKNEADLFGELVFLELLECAGWVESCDDKVAGTFEDGLACRGLDGIVVKEQNC